jgi:ATP-dependent exoDNAse (exonuclease V) alpha subunit
LIGEWDFLSDIKNKTQIIFSGDVNQLGSLGNHSNLRKHEWLFDIATKNNIIDLKNGKNYRISKLGNDHDGSKILRNLIQEKFDFKHNVKNVNWFYSIGETILKLKELVEKNYTIITQFNGGMWGVDFLNRVLKNGHSENFTIGDKIVFIETELSFINIDNQSKPKYYKGLFGEIFDIKVINYQYNKYFIKTDGKKIIEIDFKVDEIADIIEHSYVINAYKAQGSTIENVAVLSPSKVGYDWLYTAVSRFSKNIEIIFIAGGSEYIEFVKRTKK